MEKDPTLGADSESIEASQEKYSTGDYVYSNEPEIFRNALARIREVDDEKKTVKLDFFIFGRLAPNFLDIDLKDLRHETDEERRDRETRERRVPTEEERLAEEDRIKRGIY